MAYQGCDTYDHYTNPSIFYDFVAGTATISTAYARFPAISGFPNQGIKLGGGSGQIVKNLKSAQKTLIGFLSFGVAALPTTGPFGFAGLQNNGNVQCVLALNPNGSLQFATQFTGGTGALIGAPTAGGLIAAAPTTQPNHGIEFLITIDASAGVVMLWLDGALLLNQSGLNTQGSGGSFANAANQIKFQNANADTYIDYWRIWDNTGSYQNAAVGKDRAKLTKLSAGVGDLTQWSANGASANWQCVDDNPPDGDATYVSSNGNNYDSYAMGTAGLLSAPTMVVPKSYVRKDDSATRAIEVGVRSSGVNGLGPAVTLGSSYVFVDSCISTDPNTGYPPTAAAADAFQHLKYEST
jgi:hypothetical protein